MALEEEGIDLRDLLTDGATLKVVVGTVNSRASHFKEKQVDDAQALKQKRRFSHDDMAEVER